MNQDRASAPEGFLDSTKVQRLQGLLLDTLRTLSGTRDFVEQAVPKVAQLLAERLHAECVCIFFRAKVNKDLHRFAIAINEGEKAVDCRNDANLLWDNQYGKDKKTLMWEAWKNGVTLNHDSTDMAAYDKDIAEIREKLRLSMPSQCFKHLIIAPFMLFEKQLGAIRVINHLDPERRFLPSDAKFSDDQDVTHVTLIGAILAFAYSNFRKTVKSEALRRLQDEIQKATTVDEAVAACLTGLASDKTGFPWAMWRAYDDTGTSRVAEHRSWGNFDLQPAGLPLDKDKGLSLKDDQRFVPLGETTFHYHEWAKQHDLSSACPVNTRCSGRQYSLEVFADDSGDFDTESLKQIESIASILNATLERIELTQRALRQRLIGSSAPMGELRRLVEKVARKDSTVLILGETGVGKEVTARTIHELSLRADGPFVAFNCAGIHEQLLESQLFGHEKGAFTGADRRHLGYFEEAKHGTLLLDEIGDMPLTTQAKILRVLQERTIRRLNGNEDITINVRLLASTHRNLEEMTAAGTFRLDLFFRINVVEVTVPKLGKRLEDIPELARHILARLGLTAPDGRKIRNIEAIAVQRLMDYHWPGNVRELVNKLEAAANFATSDTITPEDLPKPFLQLPNYSAEPNQSVPDHGPNPTAGEPDQVAVASVLTTMTLEEAERAQILATFRLCNWNKSATARRLDIPHQTLHDKLKRLGISRGEGEEAVTPPPANPIE